VNSIAYDETPIAREMAASAGADQDVMRLSADHLYDYFEETLWHTERTIYNTLAVAKFLMSRHVRDADYKVVVTGEGSDALCLASRHLNRAAIRDTGLLNTDGVSALFELHDRSDTTAATRNALDALFNHMLGVQSLHCQFIATDVPAQARARAAELGWSAD
jgi:asparagine synthetase B (glutamine-hydrolysing)